MSKKNYKGKKRRYYKSSLIDRSIYYLEKARKSGKDEDFYFAIGYCDGIENKYTNDNKLGNNNDYHRGNIRASTALGIAKNVKF